MLDLRRINTAVPIDIMALNSHSTRAINRRNSRTKLIRCSNDSDIIAHYKYLSDRNDFYPYKYVTPMRSIFTNCATPIKCTRPTKILPITSSVERRGYYDSADGTMPS